MGRYCTQYCAYIGKFTIVLYSPNIRILYWTNIVCNIQYCLQYWSNIAQPICFFQYCHNIYIDIGPTLASSHSFYIPPIFIYYTGPILFQYWSNIAKPICIFQYSHNIYTDIGPIFVSSHLCYIPSIFTYYIGITLLAIY